VDKISLEQRLAELTSQNQLLQQQLQELKAASELQATYYRDDVEKLKAKLRRRMREDLSSLEEGLVALSRPVPKVHVMVDIVGRVISALRKELQAL